MQLFVLQPPLTVQRHRFILRYLYWTALLPPPRSRSFIQCNWLTSFTWFESLIRLKACCFVSKIVQNLIKLSAWCFKIIQGCYEFYIWSSPYRFELHMRAFPRLKCHCYTRFLLKKLHRVLFPPFCAFCMTCFSFFDFTTVQSYYWNPILGYISIHVQHQSNTYTHGII